MRKIYLFLLLSVFQNIFSQTGSNDTINYLRNGIVEDASGIYNGTYAQFSQDSNPENNFQTNCTEGFEVIEFKTKREKFKPIHCNSIDEDWVKYKYDFGNNPQTKTKENYFKYNAANYVTIIDITSKTLVLEGKLMQKYAFSGGKLFLFEK